MDEPTIDVQIGNVVRVDVGFKFAGPHSPQISDDSYGLIQKPFWRELGILIDIGKELHPKWGPEKRKAGIQAELDKRGLSQEDYERLKMRAAREFYTVGNKDDGSGEIIIPRHVLTAMLAQALGTAPKNAMPRVDRGLMHLGFQIAEGFLRTGKTKADSKTRDFLVKMQESNQRVWEKSLYIDDFTATGTFLIDETFFSVADFEKMFRYASRYVGLGSSRNQGYGHFVVVKWDVAEQVNAVEQEKAA